MVATLLPFCLIEIWGVVPRTIFGAIEIVVIASMCHYFD